MRVAREHRSAERVRAAQRDLAGRQPFVAVGVVQPELDALDQQVFAHTAAAR
jgi:hypothetical protein